MYDGKNFRGMSQTILLENSSNFLAWQWHVWMSFQVIHGLADDTKIEISKKMDEFSIITVIYDLARDPEK